MNTKIKFPTQGSQQLGDELKQRVFEYFEKSGISPKANWQMVLKTFVMLGITFGSYGLILTNSFSLWPMLGLAIMMGIGVAGIGFNISHDALHGAYSLRPRVNQLIGWSFELVGASSYMWKLMHNVIHHTYTNIEGVDEDLAISPLLRLSPEGDFKAFHKYQHLYAFFANSLVTLFWVFIKDYKYFLQRDLGPYQNKIHPASELATLFVAKMLYYAYTIVVPLLVLRVAWWQFLIGFLAMHFTAGLILGLVFQLAHVVDGPDYPAPGSDYMMEDLWVAHQFKTTANFATHNRVLGWYIGGLNFQIEHHLFPKICSIHYPRISGIVREVASKYDMPYHHNYSLVAAIHSHYLQLKKLGNPAV